MAAFLTYLTDRIPRPDVVVHGLAFGSSLRPCVARTVLVVVHNGRSQSCTVVTGNITLTHQGSFTHFIVVQPATHKGNSLKTLFTKYMTRDMTTTQVHITHEAWHDI